MPADGIKYVAKKDLLTYEEIIRLVTILAHLGIEKVRLTGGEPFVRNDVMHLIRSLKSIEGIRQIHLTTNGLLTAPFIPELKSLNIASVNLSLDTLDRQRFQQITLRDGFLQTWRTLQSLLDHDIPVKINAVVMEGKNIEDIIPMVALTRDYPVTVRFIEEMPFNGSGEQHPTWTYTRIVDYIREHYPSLAKAQDEPFSTSYNYHIEGHRGKIGVIAAFSRTFCGTCNRIRFTAEGKLKTCLYDGGVLDIRALLRSGSSDYEIEQALLSSFRSRPLNGFEAEKRVAKKELLHASMSTIGG